MDKFVLLAPLWACADLAAAAADAAKLRNHPAYARLGLVQSACGRWLVCRVVPLPEDDGGALCAATDCGLPETPAEDVCAGCGRSDGRAAADMRLAAAACSSAADVCFSIGGTAAPCGLPETAADAFGSNGKAFPADGLPESVFGDGWRPERGLA